MIAITRREMACVCMATQTSLEPAPAALIRKQDAQAEPGMGRQAPDPPGALRQ